MFTAVLQVKETEGGVKYVDVVKGEGANPSVSGSKLADSRGLERFAVSGHSRRGVHVSG